MKDPLGDLALVKGIREPHEVKKNSFDLAGNRTHDLRIRSTVTLPTELRGRTEKVGDDSHSIDSEPVSFNVQKLRVREPWPQLLTTT